MGENLWDSGIVSPAYRENTLLSFVKAVENGATFIEFDVQVGLLPASTAMLPIIQRFDVSYATYTSVIQRLRV